MIVRDKEAYSGYADVSRTQSFGSAKWDDYAQYCLDRREAILEREADGKPKGRRMTVLNYMLRIKLRVLRVGDSIELPFAFYPPVQTANGVDKINASKEARYKARYNRLEETTTITRIK